MEEEKGRTGMFGRFVGWAREVGRTPVFGTGKKREVEKKAETVSMEEKVVSAITSMPDQMAEATSKETVEQPVKAQKKAETVSMEEKAIDIGPQKSTEVASKGPIAPQGEGEPKPAAVAESYQELKPSSFVGEVELALIPPVVLHKLSALYTRIQAINEAKIVRTAGSLDMGTTITLYLDRPLPLIGILSAIPELNVKERPATGRHGSAKVEKKDVRVIDIITKEG